MTIILVGSPCVQSRGEIMNFETVWKLYPVYQSCVSVTVQISTSVQWTTEVVTLTQYATTLKEISLAPAIHDIWETDSPVQVS